MADDLEHIGGGGLLLQGLAQLIEQARIFNRDHRLVGEVLDQFDVAGGKGASFITSDDDRTNRPTLAQHRHGENDTPIAGVCHLVKVIGIRESVLDLNYCSTEDRATRGLVRLRRRRARTSAREVSQLRLPRRQATPLTKLTKGARHVRKNLNHREHWAWQG